MLKVWKLKHGACVYKSQERVLPDGTKYGIDATLAVVGRKKAKAADWPLFELSMNVP